MFTIVFWPERTRKGLMRAATLLILLGVTLALTYELSRFDPGAVYFQTITRLLGAHLLQGFSQSSPPKPLGVDTNDPYYGFAVLDQARIAMACQRFFRLHGYVPASLDELREAGLSPEFYLDPWKRRYATRVLPGGVLMVQTTGPSGVDAVSPKWLASPERHLGPAIQLVGDNLILLTKLKPTEEMQPPPGIQNP